MKLQRITALDAHRAAKDATTEAAQAAARAAGDAAAAAYLHPLAKATQVGDISRAAAHAARAAELAAGGDQAVEHGRSSRLANVPRPALVGVLRRYPPAPASKNRVGQLMKTLDTSLR